MTRIMDNTKNGFTVRLFDETTETGDGFIFFSRDGKHYQFNIQDNQFFYRELPDNSPLEPWKEVVDLVAQLSQLQDENEQLKEKLAAYDEVYFKGCECGLDDACRFVKERDQLRKRTHEIQERADKKQAELQKIIEEQKVILDVFNLEVKEGQDYYWDEIQADERPCGLSEKDAAIIGRILKQRDQYKQELDKMRLKICEGMSETFPRFTKQQFAKTNGWHDLYKATDDHFFHFPPNCCDCDADLDPLYTYYTDVPGQCRCKDCHEKQFKEKAKSNV